MFARGTGGNGDVGVASDGVDVDFSSARKGGDGVGVFDCGWCWCCGFMVVMRLLAFDGDWGIGA